jgi:DNA mismatch repair protein MutL
MIFNSLKQAVASVLSQAVEKEKISLEHPLPQSDGDHRPSWQGQSRQVDIFKFGPSRQEKQAYFDHFFQDVADGKEEKQILPVFQLANLYLLVFQEDGLLVYDQHAAEERILFEEFKQKYKQDRKNRQELLFKEKIKFSKEDLKILKKHLETLRKLGFEIKLENGIVIILAVPVVLVDKKIGPVLREFIDDLKEPEEGLGLEEESKKAGISYPALQTLYYFACRCAVKQGDRLIPGKRRQIIDSLLKLGEKGLTCPHGRPTRIKITKKELDKRFKRQET